MKHRIEEIRLANGAQGLLIDAPGAPVMDFNVIFRAGNRLVQNPEIYEVAHLMEHMAFGANARFADEQAYEQEFTKNGAYHNAWTSDCMICYEATCADFEWERIMELQELAVAQPRFNEEGMKSEKGNVRSELTGYQNDYSRLLWPKLQQSLGERVLTYGERLKTLKNIRLSDVKEHHARTHTAKNMQFVVCGDLEKRRDRIVEMFNNWHLEEGERLEIPRNQYIKDVPPTLIRRKDASNLSFGFSFILERSLSTREKFAMNTLDHILNGTMSSRIFGAARSRGLVYGVGSSLSTDAQISSWDFDGEVNEENIVELFDLITIELLRVMNGDLSREEITQAQTYGLGRFKMSAQTVGQISSMYLPRYAFENTYSHIDNDPEIIKSIDKSCIIALAREFIESGISSMCTVGDTNKALIDELWMRVKNII